MVVIQQKDTQKSWILLVFLSVGIILYSLAEPQKTGDMIREASLLFVRAVLPSLFAFSVAAKILVKSGVCENLVHTPLRFLFPILGVSAGGMAALLIGCLSGFPTGASVLSDLVLRGNMKKEEAESLLPFCNHAGASFVIGTAGMLVFGSAKAGMMLFSAQIAATLLALVLTAGKRAAFLASSVSSPASVRAVSVFTSAVTESALAMVSVCGYVIFFSVLSGAVTSVLASFLPISDVLFSAIAGFLEISGGIARLSVSDIPALGKLLMCGGFLGFGGLSVFLQVADRADAVDLSLSCYLKGKCLTAFFSAGFAALFCFFAEMRFGIYFIFAVFVVILTIGIVKNKIFFKKSVEKQKGMLYNIHEIYYP